MKKTYQSEILEVPHEMTDDLHEIEAISNTRVTEYDRDCIVREKNESSETGNAGIKPVAPALVMYKSNSLN